jgi:hypothetical protein
VDRPGFEFRWGQQIFSSLKRPDRLWDSHSLLFSEYQVPGAKQPEREFEHQIPSSAEVTNEWSNTSTPPNPYMAWIGTLKTSGIKVATMCK